MNVLAAYFSLNAPQLQSAGIEPLTLDIFSIWRSKSCAPGTLASSCASSAIRLASSCAVANALTTCACAHGFSKILYGRAYMESLRIQ